MNTKALHSISTLFIVIVLSCGSSFCQIERNSNNSTYEITENQSSQYQASSEGIPKPTIPSVKKKAGFEFLLFLAGFYLLIVIASIVFTRIRNLL